MSPKNKTNKTYKYINILITRATLILTDIYTQASPGMECLDGLATCLPHLAARVVAAGEANPEVVVPEAAELSHIPKN